MANSSNNFMTEVSRLDIRRMMMVGAGWLWVLITGVLWSLEPWQRPWLTRVPDERIWLALSCAGLLVLVLLIWQWHSRARFVGRAALVLVTGAILLAGLPVFCKNLAVGTLRSMVDEEIALHKEQVGTGLVIHHNSLAKKLQDALKKIGVGSPMWLDERVRDSKIQPAHPLIAASSWPVRKKMADVMVRDAARADYLMAFWKEYFPSFTGPDVTLECRREWLRQLDTLRKEPGYSLSTRQATLLMMALIVLTDPPEFEAWREPVRDAMIQVREPLIHPWTGQSQTFWFRILDTLLALDPPESWTRLAKPMVVEGAAFRQAMEVPVRGLVGNFDAFLPIFENSKDIDELLLLWQGAGASLTDGPDSIDAVTAERIRTWRRDTLFRLLMAQGNGSKADWALRRLSVLPALDHYPVPPFIDAQQEQLAAVATEWLKEIEKLPIGDAASAFGYLNRILHIVPYLNDGNALTFCRLFIPVVLRPEWFAGKGHTPYEFDQAWAACLLMLHTRMTEEQHLLLRDRLPSLLANMRWYFRSYHALLYLDAWAKNPALPRVQWLARAWSSDRIWKIGSKEAYDFSSNWERHTARAIPEVSEEDIDALARVLEFNLRNEEGKDVGQILAERLLVQDAAKEKYGFISRMRERMHLLGINSKSNPEWLKRELMTDLARMGLYRIDKGVAESILEKARSRRSPYGALLYYPELADRLWRELLTHPQGAASMVGDCLDGVYDSNLLSSLILAIDRSSPNDEVIRSIWNALRAGSHSGENRREIFGALFRLSHRVSESERLAMRKDYMDARSDRTVGSVVNDWGYHATTSYYMSYSGASRTYPTGYDPNPLAHAGGGIGIPWEEDELSALDSWRTLVDRQLYREPVVEPSARQREVFSYVVHGFDSDSQIPRANLPPRFTAPFPPTPWQKARELYVRRPDLKFQP